MHVAAPVRVVSAIALLLLAFPSAVPGLASAADPADDPKNVAFFEKLYKKEIKGIKPLEEYDDPDSFYAAIAAQVGIPELAYEAVNERFGWKKEDDFFMAAMVKGGWDAPYWGVMVSRVPKAIQQAKSIEERKALMKKMELKFVVIDYDGKVSFPEEDKKQTDSGTQESPPTQDTRR